MLQSPFVEQLSSSLTVVPLKRTFRFTHGPVNAGADDHFVGRGAELDSLTQRLLFSNGGSFLVTGYRGVGKTSFVNQVIGKLQAVRTWAESQQPGVELRLVPVYLNLARRLEAAELMHHIIRRLYETLAEDGTLEDLPEPLRAQLAEAYDRTSFNMTRKIGDAFERNLSLPEINLESAGAKLALKSILSTKRSLSRNYELSFLSYDDHAAENDIIRLSTRLARGFQRHRHRRPWHLPRRRPKDHEIRLKIIFVFDEIDKQDDPLVTLLEYDKAKPDGSPPTYASSLDELLSFLKSLFTTSGICFVFVAGKDLQERWLEDVGRGDSVFESVFAYHQYLPCMWSDVDPLCDALVDWEEVHSQYDWLRIRADFEDFKKYLAYVGRGIPRLIMQAFNQYVRWHGDRPLLVINHTAARRIRFYARLQELLASESERLFGGVREQVEDTLLDRRRLAVYYLIDWVLRRNPAEFTFADAVQESARLNRKIAPTAEVASVVIRNLIDLLVERDYLRTVMRGPDGVQIGDAAQPVVDLYALSPRRVAELRGQRAPVPPPSVQVPPPSPRPSIFKTYSSADTASPPSVPAPRMSEPSGNDPFEHLDVLGRGGMGIVYRALDRRTGRIVALKLLDRQLGSDPAFSERFRREAAAMSRLRHPNIVSYYESGELNGQLYIAMDVIEGLDLRQLLSIHGALEAPMAMSIAEQLADTLAFIHSQNLFRIDLKPHNIMLRKSGKICIIDFGIIKPRIDVTLTVAGGLVGTPAYMAPEQIENGSVDERADIYSLGIVMYEMMAGHNPFQNDDYSSTLLAVMRDDPVPLGQIASVSADIDGIVLRCMAKTPDARFPTAAALRDVIQLILTRYPQPDLASLVVTASHTVEQKSFQSDVATVTQIHSGPIEALQPRPLLAPNVSILSAVKSESELSDWPAWSGGALPSQSMPAAPAPAEAWQLESSPIVELGLMPPSVIVTAGPDQIGTRFWLSPSPGRVGIGRAPDNVIALRSARVSRYHAVLSLLDDGCAIEDLNSNNGTLVNGEQIRGQVNVRPGARIGVGDFELLLELPTVAESR